MLPAWIPGKNLLFDIAPRETRPAPNFDDCIQTALNRPIGAPTLADQVLPGMKIIIISDDNTRPTPTRRILPLLLDHLNGCGIPDHDIRILISSGTHRPMTEAELHEKYGPNVRGRVTILPHRYKDPDELVDCGHTQSGVPITVNRHALQADFRIAIGNIVPHHPAGWSAGAKAVLPGIGGEETVARMHLFGSCRPALGVIESAMRREMEDFAGRIGLNFILNVVLNRTGALVSAFAGHYVDAHRAGVAVARQVYGAPIPQQADLVISSTAPVDFDFFQGDKGITSAEPAVRLGGEILCVTGCKEGVSPAHPELAEYVGRMTNPEIWAMLEHGAPDPLTAAEAIVINDIRDRVKITLATEGLTPEICRAMGMGYITPDGLDAYLKRRLHQEPELKIGVMRQSAELLPFVAPQ
jgi:nickel-dependent lactate racemase